MIYKKIFIDLKGLRVLSTVKIFEEFNTILSFILCKMNNSFHFSDSRRQAMDPVVSLLLLAAIYHLQQAENVNLCGYIGAIHSGSYSPG